MHMVLYVEYSHESRPTGEVWLDLEDEDRTSMRWFAVYAEEYCNQLNVVDINIPTHITYNRSRDRELES